MTYEDIRNDKEFEKWFDYLPNDTQYLRYADDEPYLIAAGHKIFDVYQSFCFARVSVLNANANNFGDLCGSSVQDRLFIKSYFLINAILRYAICLDISWQVVWAYIQPSSLEYLLEQKYKEMEKFCARDSVKEQLNCIISQNGKDIQNAQKILEVVTDFDNDKNTMELRKIYNKIKHHGAIHIEGLGANFDSLEFLINGKKIPMLHQGSYKISEIEKILFEYHHRFEGYMNTLIEVIIPEDYLNSEVKLSKVLGNMQKMTTIRDKIPNKDI